MIDIQREYTELRAKMSSIDTLVSNQTQGAVSAFFDPISLDMSFNTSEVSFIHLITFFYSVTHEGVTRINVDFLIDKLRTRGYDAHAVEKFKLICHHLRTKFHHNMNLTKQRDQQIIYTCEDWYEKECGNKKPSTEAEWNKCATVLLHEYQGILSSFEQILTVILDPESEFASTVIEDWSTKFTHFYPHHAYVKIAHEVAKNFGYGWLDLTKFCIKYHQSWLTGLADAKEYVFEQIAQQQIEKQLLIDVKAGNLLLPITAGDIIAGLDLKPGPDIKRLYTKAQELYLERLYTVEEMIEALRPFLHTTA